MTVKGGCNAAQSIGYFNRVLLHELAAYLVEGRLLLAPAALGYKA